MTTLTAIALGSLLAWSILVQWVPARWPVSMLQAGVFGLGILWGVRQLIRPVRLRGSVLLWLLGAMLLWGMLQLALGQTVYSWETWSALLVWATHFVIIFLALQIFYDPRLGDRFLRAAIVFACLLAIVSVLQLYTAGGHIFWLFDSGYRDFVMGPFVYKNQYAAFMELLLPVALAALLTEHRHTLLYAAIAAAMFASVIAAVSRAGFVLASAELVLVPLLFAGRKFVSWRRAALLFAAVGGLTLIFAWAAGWQVLWDRLQKPDPYAVRREFLQSSLAMIRDRPVMGFGLGTWSTAYPAYALFDRGEFANQAHNDWAQWACEGGLVFAGVMLWLAIWTVRAARRVPWGIGAVAVLLHCAVDYPIQRPAWSATFFLFLGLLASAQKPAKIA